MGDLASFPGCIPGVPLIWSPWSILPHPSGFLCPLQPMESSPTQGLLFLALFTQYCVFSRLFLQAAVVQGWCKKKKKFHIKKSDVETTMWKSFTCSHANTPGFTAIPRGIHFWQFGLDQVSLLLACMHTYIYFTCPHTYFLITPHLLPYKYC